MCCRRNFNPPRTRSTTSGHSKLLSQFPRTTITCGPIARSSSRIVSAHTSPRCQISSASLAISFTLSGKRLCVSARTKMRRTSFDFFCMLIARFRFSTPRHLQENSHRGPDAELSRSEEHTSELQSRLHLVCRLLLEKKKKKYNR